jgi:hypothetical protein
MTHTEIIVVDSGYFDPNDGFAARPIVGSQGLPVSGYDEGAPFYHVVPSSEWWGDEYEWNWGPSTVHGHNVDGAGQFTITEMTVTELLGLPITISGADFVGSIYEDYYRLQREGLISDALVIYRTSISAVDEDADLIFFDPPPAPLRHYPNTFRIPVWKYNLGDKKENNPDVETEGYNAPFGINFFFPTEGAGDLGEDWQLSSRFGDVRWYEQSGLIPTYPSNHPDESRDPSRSPNPKERVYGYQGSRDAAGAANNLEAGNPKSSTDSSTDGSFSNAADSTNTNYVLGMEDAFLHYYEDTYSFVFRPGGRSGPTRTLVNKFEALDFNERFHHRDNNKEITDKADKIFGVQIAQDSLYAKSGYRKMETEEPEIDPSGDYTATGNIRRND